MQTLKFKTNINCGGCVRGVTPSLNDNEHIRDWKVDLESEDRILTVEADDEITAHEVSAVVADAGFNAQPIGS
ncbi:copper chaperone CopZ [Lewinella marina]|uniref:HMA domain-containing protein n=1 Tax=Neolewinella marina TaxID=438751 RepID=A0A2G0CHI6_9BACT|nr:heavy-metal-associated domain-containing protein [Neolewinella marina]NJB86078.1 copper chaperone CopZ [Neolewinella marina]PHK99443.1 hypothetical protein CGL56_08300 [Neolewinella marina]